MGYTTRYEIEATGFKEETEAEFFLFKLNRVTNHGFSGSTTSNRASFETDVIKWYEWKTDLKELSVHFPHVTIDVEGLGEDNGDIWKARVRNGETEVVEAVLTFPDFEQLV
jgi:hypothetical protein